MEHGKSPGSSRNPGKYELRSMQDRDGCRTHFDQVDGAGCTGEAIFAAVNIFQVVGSISRVILGTDSRENRVINVRLLEMGLMEK